MKTYHSDYNTYISFDLETTGLNSKNCEIIEIAAIKIEAGKIIDTFQTLVKPTISIPREVIKLTGITNDMVSNAPDIEDVLPSFLSFIEEYLLLGHNIASFDLHVLNRFSESVTGNSISNFYIDTLHSSKKIIPGYTSYSLDFIARYCNVHIDTLHRALDDAILVHKCFEYMINEFPERICCLSPKQFIPMSQRQNCRNSGSSGFHYSSNTKSLQVLQGILIGIIADNLLTESEVLALKSWLNQNRNLAGNYPYDRVFEIIEDALSDDIVEQKELDEMLALFHKLTSPIKECSCGQNISMIEGKLFCLTGEFEYGERKEVEALIEASGGVCRSSVTGKTDFLIIGAYESENWSCGNYGTKIKKALELQEKGKNIQIIKEKDFFKILQEQETLS